MIDLELTCVKLISSVGAARSNYIEAIQHAKKGDFEKAEILMSEGKKLFKEGHQSHAALIQGEAAGDLTAVNLLLIHAEDHLMSAEILGVMAQELIELYQSR